MSVLDFIFDANIHAQKPEGKSLTIPNQALSIREIVRRYQAGTCPPVAHQVSYNSNADFDDAINVDIDLVDRQEAFYSEQDIRKKIAKEKAIFERNKANEANKTKNESSERNESNEA